MLAETMARSRRESVVCKECRGEVLFDSDSGEQVCSVCGVVSTPSFAAYSPIDQARQLHEEPETRMVYDVHLHTLIGNERTDANGRYIQQSHDFDQLRRLNNSTISRDSKISNQMKALDEINRLTEALGLSNLVAKEAQELYHAGLNNGIIRGRSIANMSAACILIACKTIGVSCSSEDLERCATNVDARTARRYYRLLIRRMNLKVNPTNPGSFISGIAGKAGMSVAVQRKAMEILTAVENYPSLVDKRSISLAAASLYLGSISVGERTNQLRLAFAAGITPITIRKRSAEISRVLEELKTGVTASPEEAPSISQDASGEF
jgi:transcription initiation factor TFIIB